MTDAFRCNGCGEYYDREFELARVDLTTENIQFMDLTLDDISTEVYSILEDDGRGEFCPDCGLDLLQDLVARFEEVTGGGE